MKKLNEEETLNEVTEVEHSNNELEFLYNADPNCNHEIEAQWSGVKCTKCSGLFCY